MRDWSNLQPTGAEPFPCPACNRLGCCPQITTGVDHPCVRFVCSTMNTASISSGAGQQGSIKGSLTACKLLKLQEGGRLRKMLAVTVAVWAAALMKRCKKQGHPVYPALGNGQSVAASHSLHYQPHMQPRSGHRERHPHLLMSLYWSMTPRQHQLVSPLLTRSVRPLIHM